ncbi:MAG: 4-(cytidine 5'-diphospho)-2-C-methyl-D-erythritol kinase [Bacteroidota bacterium]
MIAFSNGKINLGLHVINKRDDGFHDLETVFYPVPLNDSLELILNSNNMNKEISFHSYGLQIDGSIDDNLVVKAYHLLAKDFSLKKVDFYLLKNIPMGAGLGGGSSNAAFALKMLNDYFLLNLTLDQLKKYAAILGSDCAFFIENKPSFAKGRGELLEPIAIDLKGYYLVLVKPNIHVSTAQAFANVFKRGESEVSLKELIKQPVENWKGLIENDFEKTVFIHHPTIALIKEQLYVKGAIYASMSGSGASVFGLFKSEINLKQQFENNFYFSCQL